MELKKILALADIHIFKNKRFEEHEFVFSELESEIKKNTPELILILGDVIDSKNNLSPEQIKLVRQLFIMLSNYSRVAYIIGNHDRSLQTDNRLDSLSTIVNTVENPKHEIVFLEKSQVYDLGYSNCKFAVWSWVENNKKPIIEKNKNDYLIGLFHGVIDGAVTKDGHKLTGGTPITEFDDCNIVIAGDIHNKTSFRNDEIHYVSSLLQVSVNEDALGGYMTYEWNGETFIPTRKFIRNPEAIETIHIDEYDKLTNIDVKNIRLKYDTDEVNRKEIRKVAKTLSENFGVKVTTYPVIKKKKKFIVESQKEENVEGSLDYFELFIEKNKERLEITNKDFDELKKINNRYKTENEIEYEPGDYNLISLEIVNLLSYKEENIILSNEGLIGILGKNRAGKSSIIKILQFILFGVLPNNILLYSFLNKHNRDKIGKGSLIFEKLGKYYKITRTITPKKGKKADGGLDFDEVTETGEFIASLNGATKTETEKEIKKYLGINDYFEILSIFSAQKKQIEFIDCKNAERLSLLNKFLNLQEFEEKEKRVKEDIKLKEAVLKNKLVQYNKDYNLEELQDEIELNTKELKEKTEKSIKIKENYDKTQSEYEKINQLYNENYNTSLLNGDKTLLETELADLNTRLNNLKQEIKTCQNEAKNTELLISLKEKYKEEKEVYENMKAGYMNKYSLSHFHIYSNIKEITILQSEIKHNNSKLVELIEQSKVDKCALCGEKIKEEVLEKIREKISKVKNAIQEDEELLKKLEKTEEVYKDEFHKIESYSNVVKHHKEQFEAEEERIENLERKISKLELESSKIQNEILQIQQSISKVDEVIKAKEIIKNIKHTYDELQNELSALEFNYRTIELQIKEASIAIKHLEEKVQKSTKLKEEINNEEKEISLLKVFREIVSKKGLPLFVLNQNIEEINNKINSIVSQVFDFELNFNVNEEKGEVTVTFIYPEDAESSEANLASGSETFLINLCIKVGLSQISKLPKVTSLFVDEGYDVLDPESISKLPNVFEVLKNYYQNIYTITHLDEVKEILDTQINLHKINDYTYIE